MAVDPEQLREALNKLVELLSSLADGPGGGPGDAWDDRDVDKGELVCIPKELPARLQVAAARTAIDENPANAPSRGGSRGMGENGPISVSRAAIMTTRYWGPQPRVLSVSFMEGASNALKNRILEHMNAWSRTACISFQLTNGTGNVRISRGRGGYYSYVGTDIKRIPTDRQTMNLEGFTENTRESEYRRVVRHEAGHTLGFEHEHARSEIVAQIDRAKCYAYYAQPPMRWSRRQVDQQILTPLEDASLYKTDVADTTSIMCYQLPASIMKNNRRMGGADINEIDYWFAGTIYPKSGSQRDIGGCEGARGIDDDDDDFLETPLDF